MEPQEFQPDLNLVSSSRRALSARVRKTPLVPSLALPNLFFKLESLQVTGSFKIRPAYSQLLHLPEEIRRRGIVTSSSGNFAQAAAFAARELGISACIVMMPSAKSVKVERTRRFGGRVEFCEDSYESRSHKVEEIRKREQRAVIHPFDHPAAIAGNGTVALEMLEQCPELENVVVPVSGGGLISGIAFTLKSHSPSIRVWGVQPSGSNAAWLSFTKGTPLSIARSETIADGLTVTRPGSLTFPILQKYVDDMVIVQEESIRRAIRHFVEEEKLVVEPAGAVPLAAILEEKVPRENTVLLVSGGNIDLSLLSEVLGDRFNPKSQKPS